MKNSYFFTNQQMKKKLDELFYKNYRGNKKITEKMSSKHKKTRKNGIFDPFLTHFGQNGSPNDV